MTAIALSAMVVSGCTRQVAVTPPSPPASALAVCAKLFADLPGTVAGAQRRVTTPDTGLTAAWGDPPIVLRCGVPRPTGLTSTAVVTRVQGPRGDAVDWFAEDLTRGALFTTSGRQVRVEVAVPIDYAAQAGGLTDLGAAINAADPVVTSP